MWEREEEFVKMLDRVTKKATKSSVDAIADMAIGEEKWGYKHVVGLLKRAMAKCGRKERINVLYIISSICRASRTQLGSKDKYVERFIPLLPSIAKLIAEAPAEHLVQAEKVLQTWQRDDVFPAALLSKFEDVLKKESALAAFKSKKKKSDNILAIPRPPEGDDAMDLDNNLPPPPANTTFRSSANGVPKNNSASKPSGGNRAALESTSSDAKASASVPELPLPPSIEQPAPKKVRGSRWGQPLPAPPEPPAQQAASAASYQPSSSQTLPTPPQVHKTISKQHGTFAHHVEGAACDRPASNGASALLPAPPSQQVELVNIEDAIRRSREMAAKFAAAASRGLASQASQQLSGRGEAASANSATPLPPPPPQPSRWSGLTAASAAPASQGLALPPQPPLPLPPLPANIPGPRPPPGPPPSYLLGNSQQPSFPLQRLTLPAPPAPPAGPHPYSIWPGAQYSQPRLAIGTVPGPRPPPPLPPTAPPSSAAFQNGMGSGAQESNSSKEQAVPPPPPPPSLPNGSTAPAQQPPSSQPASAANPSPTPAPAQSQAPRPKSAATEAASCVPGLGLGIDADKGNEDDEWWSAAASSLPSLDGVMSPH